ncbi:glycosyltransferase family 2 protein [Parablautia muri]|uniref:Glycosyltransferase n=1 Tax=Parablautia muri TaxID=2320879 RepID=A0A9X5BE19_9FIRM|nr:glycosyltransferase family 2 protein [Parablautia muri]NBJ92115.1 glycosyltransferase [Parablautia muri]
MSRRKKICVVVPCYNEKNSITLLYEKVRNVFKNELVDYDYQMVFADDYSSDDTRKIIREICEKDPEHVKAVFNAANFGFSRNVFSSLQMADGDAAFLVFGDLQDPPELLTQFIEKWEAGKLVVIGQKSGSDEKWLMSAMRKLYYTLIGVFSDKTQIKHFNGFGLYDKKFISILRQIEEMQPYLKQVIAEYATDYGTVSYKQSISKRGKSNFNLYKNYDFAMEGITSSTKKLMRLSTCCGVLLGIASAAYAISVMIKKLMYWDSYPFGMASITVGIFFLGAMQLFFIGILGEYMLSINTKTLKRPRVVIAEKINFNDKEEEI